MPQMSMNASPIRTRALLPPRTAALVLATGGCSRGEPLPPDAAAAAAAKTAAVQGHRRAGGAA